MPYLENGLQRGKIGGLIFMFIKVSGEFCSKISGMCNELMRMDWEVSVQIDVDLQPARYSAITCHEGFLSLH